MTDTKSTNYILIILLSLLASYIASTRMVFATNSDDLIRYYDAYINIPSYTIWEYLGWENRELLFQLYNFFIYESLGEISPNSYLFFITLPCFFIYAISLSKVKNDLQFRFLFFLSLFLPPILMYNTQLIRQGLAFYFLFAFCLVDEKA
ncbi:hypothetical protein AAEZ94_003227 [Providencia rettgeri]|nr:hypothetical protein [Providencia rettgeri]